MSLNDPVRINIAGDNTNNKNDGKCASVEQFAVPEGLQHFFVVVPSKLRLATLTSFILWKCKVGSIVVAICKSATLSKVIKPQGPRRPHTSNVIAFHFGFTRAF